MKAMAGRGWVDICHTEQGLLNTLPMLENLYLLKVEVRKFIS